MILERCEKGIKDDEGRGGREIEKGARSGNGATAIVGSHQRFCGLNRVKLGFKFKCIYEIRCHFESEPLIKDNMRSSEIF